MIDRSSDFLTLGGDNEEASTPPDFVNLECADCPHRNNFNVDYCKAENLIRQVFTLAPVQLLALQARFLEGGSTCAQIGDSAGVTRQAVSKAIENLKDSAPELYAFVKRSCRPSTLEEARNERRRKNANASLKAIERISGN